MLPKKRYVLSWAWIVTQFILQGQARGCQIPKDPQYTAWAGWQVSRGGSRIRGRAKRRRVSHRISAIFKLNDGQRTKHLNNFPMVTSKVSWGLRSGEERKECLIRRRTENDGEPQLGFGSTDNCGDFKIHLK